MQSSLASIVSLAKEIARHQGVLASSPAQVEATGEVVMCAAACLGFAALQLGEGRASAACFRRSLTSTSDASLLEVTFDRVGLGASVCSRIRIENDQMGAAERLGWFLDHVTVEGPRESLGSDAVLSVNPWRRSFDVV